jgi:hypothetical protein
MYNSVSAFLVVSHLRQANFDIFLTLLCPFGASSLYRPILQKHAGLTAAALFLLLCFVLVFTSFAWLCAFDGRAAVVVKQQRESKRIRVEEREEEEVEEDFEHVIVKQVRNKSLLGYAPDRGGYVRWYTAGTATSLSLATQEDCVNAWCPSSHSHASYLSH